MTFRWHDLEFEGAFRHPGDLRAEPGVYVIWCNRGSGWAVLDIGESDDVRARVLSHDRKDCWARHCTGEILYAARYTQGIDPAGRRRLESELRATERPPCGAM